MTARSDFTRFRRDIQLWRGLAVLAVMLAHFGALLPGGFLGVDIFFAISGFVITLSFLALLQKGQTWKRTVFEFWRRRFWRLVPALVIVISATMIFAFFLLTPKSFGTHVEMGLWSTFFAGNIGVELVTQADYFDPGAKENWLLHLWSLGVEEQFYILFPFIFLGFLGTRFAANRRRALAIGIVVLSLISLALASINDFAASLPIPENVQQILTGSSVLGYYSPVTRAWQFGIGILGALLASGREIRPRASLSIVGIVALGASLALFPASDALPGPLTVVPMVAIAVLLASPLPERITGHITLRPLTWLGDRSYSAYLWHWPLWSVLSALFPPSPWLVPTAIALTALLAHLTYRYVEMPFIRGRVASATSGESIVKPPGPRLLLSIAISFAVAFGPAILALQKTLQQFEFIDVPAQRTTIDPKTNCVVTHCVEGQIDILLVGDSHAGALFTELEIALSAAGRSLRGAVSNGCLHLLSTAVTSSSPECVEVSKNTRAFIAQAQPNIVILYGYTAGRFSETNSGANQEIALIDADSASSIPADKAFDAYRVALLETVKFITSVGSRVVIVTGTPDFAQSPHDVLQSGQKATQFRTLLSAVRTTNFGQTISREQFLSRHGPFLSIEEQFGKDMTGVEVVDSWGAICGSNICSSTTQNGDFVFSDTDHLSSFGAQLLAAEITKTVQEIP